MNSENVANQSNPPFRPKSGMRFDGAENPLVPKEVRTGVSPNSPVHLTLLETMRTDCDGGIRRMA